MNQTTILELCWLSYKEESPAVYSFDEMSAAELRFRNCSWSSQLFLLFFIQSLFDSIRWKYPQWLAIVLLSKSSNASLIWQFNCFRFFSFATFPISMEHNSMPNSIPIPWQYIFIAFFFRRFFHTISFHHFQISWYPPNTSGEYIFSWFCKYPLLKYAIE